MGYGGPVETGGAIRPFDRETELALRRARWRHRLLFGFAVLLILVVSAIGVHWFNNNIRYVSTDDAYVDAQLAEVAPEIDGTIARVAVTDTQSVSAATCCCVSIRPMPRWRWTRRRPITTRRCAMCSNTPPM